MRGRLLAPDVATLCLGGFERGHHPLGERGIARREGTGHGVPDGVLFHEVGLAAESVAERVAGGRDAPGAGVRGHVAGSIDDGALANLGFRVAGGQGRERLLGGVTGLQELEPQRAVTEVDVRLRRHRTDSGLGPRHGRADLEVVRLHGDSELAGLLVTRDDGVGQGALS